MQNSIVLFIFFVLGWEYVFWANLVEKIKIVNLSSNLVLRLIRKSRIQWWYSSFLVLAGSTRFSEIFFEKSVLFVEPRLIQICRIRWWFSFFFFRLFWANFVYVKFDGGVHFFCFRPYFVSFTQKIHLAFWCYVINLLAVYSQSHKTSGFSCVNLNSIYNYYFVSVSYFYLV